MLAIFIISGILGLIGAVFGLLTFIFWLWMLVDCIQNNRLSGSERVLWALVIFFLPCIGSLDLLSGGPEAVEAMADGPWSVSKCACSKPSSTQITGRWPVMPTPGLQPGDFPGCAAGGGVDLH